ncbi:unnamed protein product [Rhizoctonia solani]|uniref:F-box domain-containing protein n=1 Tax=Rhizoctonia solani TaxID=456999 RepID=A0A8H3GST1_9AGAM|nr:unnamed protein product [Rhizoctonia solani]
MDATNWFLFDRLSHEMVVHILEFCNFQTILRFASTCKRAHNLVTNTTSLQLLIELEASGLELIEGASSSNVSTSLTLERLKRYQNAWANFDLLPPKGYAWMKGLGVGQGHRFVFFEGYLAATTPAEPDEPINSLELCNIRVDLQTYSIRFGASLNGDFYIDQTQDLVVILESISEESTNVSLRLCSLTTGLSHPLALRSPLTFATGYLPQSSRIQVVERRLMINIRPQLSELIFDILVWDWIPGTLLHRISFEPSYSMCDCTFLGSEYLLVFVASQDKWCTSFSTDAAIFLEIYPISGNTLENHLDDTDTHPIVPELPVLMPTLRLEMPTLRSSCCIYGGLRIQTGPLSGYAGQISSTSFVYARPLTLVLDMVVERVHPTGAGAILGKYCIFVDISHIFDFLQGHKQDGDAIRTLCWNDWGEKSTRWILHPVTGDAYTMPGKMFGSRFIVGETCNKDDEPFDMISIIDFHTPTVKRHSVGSSVPSTPSSWPEELIKEHKNLVTQGKGLYVSHILHEIATKQEQPVHLDQAFAVSVTSDQPTIIEGIFKQAVVSRLPYRMVTKVQAQYAYISWMIDSEHIIGIGELSEEDEIIVLVYDLRTDGME